MRTRVFLGNHWLYEVDTELGKLQVTQANVHAPTVNEGEVVGLLWSAEHARMLPLRAAA